MIVSLDKLLSYKGNKYIFSKAAMAAIDKIGNIKGYPEEDEGKIVSNILNIMLDDKVKFSIKKDKDEEEEKG